MLFSLFVCSESYCERITRCQTSIFVKLSVLKVNQSLEAVCYDNNCCFIVPWLPVVFKLLSQTLALELAACFRSHVNVWIQAIVDVGFERDNSFFLAGARAALVAESKYFFLRKKLIRHYERGHYVFFKSRKNLLTQL